MAASRFFVFLCALAFSSATAAGAEPASTLDAPAATVKTDATPAPAGEKPQQAAARYLLRYRFLPGEEIRWEVVDEKTIDMNVAGTASVAEMYSRSSKVWRIKSLGSDGSAVIENLVDEVDMRQKFTGRMEVRYNSRTDKEPPLHFENVAKSIGVPLSRVTLDPRGKILKRERLTTLSAGGESEITLPLPEQAVAVGETWTVPADLTVPLQNKTVKKLKTQQSFTLERVEGTVATIRMATQILTPLNDPALQTQIMHRETLGTVRLDMKAGRILGQEIAADKRILGFAGDASVCQYKVRFTEKLTSRVPELAVPTKGKATDANAAATETGAAKPATPKTADAKTAPALSATNAADATIAAKGEPAPIRTADARASAAKAAAKSVEAKPADAKTADSAKPSDVKPSRTMPMEPRASDRKPAGVKSNGSARVDTQPAELAPPPALPKSAARRLLPATADIAPAVPDAPLPATAQVQPKAPEAPLPPSTKLAPGKNATSRRTAPADAPSPTPPDGAAEAVAEE